MVEYSFHGIRFVITSSWERFLQYVALNFGAFPSSLPSSRELRLSVRLIRKPWLAPPLPGVTPKETKEERWGDDLVSDGRSVRFRYRSLDLAFDGGEPSEVRATYRLDRTNRLQGVLRPVPSWEEIQAVARLALYLPLFLLMERSGAIALHAAAVARKGQAVVLTGLNGSGKSTLCSSLLDRVSYMADNYVFWNGNEILGFPEALRLPPSRAPPSPVHLPMVWGKRIVPVDAARTTLTARPAAIVFLTLGRRTEMTALTESEAQRRLEIIQDMTAEFPRYGYLGPVSPARDAVPIPHLTGLIPSYALVVGDVESARRKVLDLLGET